MRSIRSHFLGTLCFGTALLALPAPGNAQAISTASRGLDIAAFGGFAEVETDYAHYKDGGGTFGVDVTRYYHLPVTFSLEGRATIVDGKAVNETTYLGGLRVEVPVGHRLHPYGAFLAGSGTLHFKYQPSPGFTSSRGLTISYGGGVDFDLFRNLQFKIDAQYQNWNLGPNGVIVPQGGNFTLTPLVGTVGVEYHIPFRPRVKQSDYYR